MFKRKALLVLVGVGLLIGVGIQGWALQFTDPSSWAISNPDPYPILVAEQSDTIDYATDRDYFTITLSGGVPYEITLSVPLWTDFDIAVFDENGNLVGHSENGAGETETVYISPAWTGPFYIVVYSYNGDTGSYAIQVRR